MPLVIDPAIIGQEFDRTVYPPVTPEELIAFSTAVGATRPAYTVNAPDLVAYPTYCVRYQGRKFYPDTLPSAINLRTGFDAGKDIEFGVPIRPGDSIEVSSTLHEIYEKTGRTGSMYFVVIRFTMTNQRGEQVAVIDNRFMHR
jgi:acyl dehydratase